MPTSHPRFRSGSRPKLFPKILSWLLGGLKPVAMLACNVVSVRANAIAAGKTIGPDVAELIEMIVAAAGDEVQVFDRMMLDCAKTDACSVSSLMNVGCGPNSCEMNGRSWPASTSL